MCLKPNNMFIKTFLSVLLSFFFISFFSISYTQDYVDISLKEIDMLGVEQNCPPGNGYVQDVVIAPASGASGVGIGWGANLYLQSEVGAANTIFDLTWIIGTSTGYGGTTYTFDNTDIWMYEYTGVQFPTATRPDVQAWSTGSLPSGVSNLVKVMANGKIILTDVEKECISSTVNSLDIPYVYSGTKSLVIYIEKKTPAVNSKGSNIAWPTFKHNSRESARRRVCNWEGTLAVPLNSNSLLSTSSAKKFARIVFNRVKANRKINKTCSTTDFLDVCVISTCVIKSITPSATSVCKGGTDITFTKDPTTVAGTFSSTSGLVIDPTTGKINATTSDPGNYAVTFTETADATCKVTANIEIKESGDASKIAITSNTPICEGKNAVFTITGTAGQKVTYTGVTSANTSPITLDGTGKAIVTVTNVTSNKTIILGTVSNSTNTCPTTITGSNSTATVVVNPKPVISDITKSICSGLKFDTIPVANATNIIPVGTTYTWAVPSPLPIGILGASNNNNPQTNISQTLSNSTNAPIDVVYTVTATSPNQCSSTFNVTVTVKPKPATPTFSNVNQPTCNTSGTAEINPFESAPATYVFKPSTGISNNGKNITAASGKYKFVVIKDGCASDSSALLTMNDVPDKPVLEGPSSVCMGSKITLKAWKNKTTIGTTESTSAATTPWTKDDIADPKISIANLVDPNTTSIEISTIKSGSVKITYTDINACTAEQTITVNPLPDLTSLSYLPSPIFAGDLADSVCKGSDFEFTLTGGKVGYKIYFKDSLITAPYIIKSINNFYIKNVKSDLNIVIDSISDGKCRINAQPLKISIVDSAFSLKSYSTSKCGLDDGKIEVNLSSIGKLSWKSNDLVPIISGSEKITTISTYSIASNTPVSSSSNSSLKKGNYSVSFNNGGCVLTKSISIKDPNRPFLEPLTTSNPLSVCAGDNILMKAWTDKLKNNPSIPNTVLAWASDNNKVSFNDTINSLITIKRIVALTGGSSIITYTDNNNCSIDTLITINSAGAPTTVTNADKNQQFCKSENADISKLKPTTGVVWFDVNGNKKNNLAELLTETSYYAAIQDANGCYTKSTDRIEVKVKIIENPLSPVVGGPTVFCKADNKSIADLLPKSSPTTEIRWFLESDLTNPILSTTPPTPLTTGKYVPKAYVDGCYSLNTTPITVTIEDPQAPTLPTSKLCENNTVPPRLYDFYPNDGNIRYYEITNDSPPFVALANKYIVKGEKYDVRTVTNNGCISLPTEINIDASYFSSGVNMSSNPYDFTLTPLCEIDKPDFDLAEAKFNTLPSSNGTILWYQGKNDVLENNLPKDILINSGSYWIAVKGTDGCFSKKQEVKLKVDAGVKPTLKPIELCYTSSYKVADLDVANVSNPVGILTWYLAKDGTVSLDKIGPVTNDPNVQYWATYKKTNTECESNEKVKLDLTWIKFNQQLQLDETSQKFCKSKTNKVSDLNLSPNTSTNVAWFQTLTEVTPIDPTTNLFEDKYYAGEFKMTTDNKYCVNSQRNVVDVSFYSSKMYPLVKESVCTKQNGSIEFLNPPAGYVFSWYETSNINVLDFTGTKYLKPLEKQSFKIVMEDAKGCKDEVTISMPLCSDAPIPQFLTPQSPGGNDKWVISFSAKYTKVQVRIFNRWGNEVYVSPIPYMDDWDGKRDNEYLPTGTYYYVIDKGNGDPIVTGFIELVK